MSSSSPLSREWGSGAECSELLNMLGLSGDQPPSRSPIRVATLEQKMLLSPRKFKGFRNSVSGTRVKELRN